MIRVKWYFEIAASFGELLEFSFGSMPTPL